MKLHSDLPVYKSTYDLLLGIFCFTKSLVRNHHYDIIMKCDFYFNQIGIDERRKSAASKE
jgi:hypothetical protein